ncbi:MAG TPA: glycosyltransferase, partial [Emcibacteraceae bacterium]|nr:glycosyltransferase [Emcibacteraceae bacterium]
LKDKGVIEVVEAAKHRKILNFKVRIVNVGDVDMGNPSSVSVGEIKEWVDDGYVEHWGFKNNMAKTLSEANIVCLPSYREGMPKSLIEATASSRVIITTDVPGCREMIDKNNPNGILIPAGSSIALSDAIIDILSDKKKRQIMAFNGRKMAEKEFSINQVVKSTLKIYEDLLN